MSNQKEERVTEMAAIRMPTEQMDFIRRNTIIAEKVGKFMVMLADMQKAAQDVRNLLSKPDLFKQFLENGTEEELTKFLQVCVKVQENPDGIFHAKNVPEEAFDKIMEKMGDHVVATKIDDTKLFRRKNEQSTNS